MFIGFLYRKLVEFSICCIYLFKKYSHFLAFVKAVIAYELHDDFIVCLPYLANWFFRVSGSVGKCLKNEF